jgi:hypothetical protein
MVSPTDYQENLSTLNTLRYASKASKIRNKPSRSVGVVQGLMDEIKRLIKQVSDYETLRERETGDRRRDSMWIETDDMGSVYSIAVGSPTVDSCDGMRGLILEGIGNYRGSLISKS